MKQPEELPDGASRDDLMYELYVRRKIAEGVKAADEGRVVSQEEVKRRFLSAGRSPKPWERR